MPQLTVDAAVDARLKTEHDGGWGGRNAPLTAQTFVSGMPSACWAKPCRHLG